MEPNYPLVFLYSFGGAILTWIIIEGIFKPYIRDKSGSSFYKGKKHLSEVPLVVFFSGYLEVVLYSGSFLIGKPEFIILWIGVKTALRWDRKSTKTREINDFERRGIYHTFLMGTALNIVFGFLSAFLVNKEILTFIKDNCT